MLIQLPSHSSRRAIRREQRISHDETRNTPSLGCTNCRQLQLCGGLCTKAPVFYCLDFCCNTPSDCDKVCPRNPDYVDRVREIDGFSLDTIPRAAPVPVPQLPSSAPLLFHGSRRSQRLESEAVAIPLARMYRRQDGSSRYGSHEAICAAFQIKPGTPLILSGTDHDASIERWWGLEESNRRTIIRALRESSIALVTVPNYSLFTNVPRWDDLHAMKRIALTHHEFISEGLPAAIHINGRTDTDFRRWAEYISDRPEVNAIAYEFATGPGRSSRTDIHVTWLCELAARVPQPLHLVVRGGIDRLSQLRRHFSSVIFLDTSSFMKTMMRKQATLQDGNRLTWSSTPTDEGQPLDELLLHNIASVRRKLTGQHPLSPAVPDIHVSRDLAYADV